MDMETLAKEYLKYFTLGTRQLDNGKTESFVHNTEECPEELKDAIYNAHDDMLPDDRIYELFQNTLEKIAAGDDIDDIMPDNMDIYTHDKCAWMSSHAFRYCAVNEAIEEGANSLDSAIEIAQYNEENMVIECVKNFLETQLEERESA